MKTLLAILACGLLCGCEPTAVQTMSSGSDIVTTNGAVWVHTWQHNDRYTLISNTPPQ